MIIHFHWPDSIPRTEYSEAFIQGMLDRMGMSYSTYGKVKDAFPDKVDAVKSLERRLQKYLQTGNTEWLIDVANFAMIEFMHPSHKDAHFKSTEAKESPGRKWHGESISRKDRNDAER